MPISLGEADEETMRTTWLLAACLVLGTGWAAARDYDVVYVRAPRAGDRGPTKLPDVTHPLRIEAGSDLMLLHPDGGEEVLFAAGPGAVLDPALSFDAEWVYFSYIPDARPSALNPQRDNLPLGGADIYKLHLKSRRLTRLTHQEWTPAEGAGLWSRDHLRAVPEGTHYLGYGMFNLGACPLPGGRVMFVSSRDGYLPNKTLTFPNLRLYIMDDDGENVEPVGHLNIGSALHPTVMRDGRVMFSSYETQGNRDDRVWALWAIRPDGRHWEPLMSAFTLAQSFHFQTQLSDGKVAVVEYYNLNNHGFGTLLAFSTPENYEGTVFGAAKAEDASNPPVARGLWWFEPGHPSHAQMRYKQYPFSPPDLVSLTRFTHGEDEAASRLRDGRYAGKVTHPSGVPDGGVLLTWSPGPVNVLERPESKPEPDAGIYLLPGGRALDSSDELELVKNDPRYHEIQARAVVPYRRIYGVDEPARLDFLPNDGGADPDLPAGTPYGLVGAPSVTKRDTAPGKGHASYGGLDAFNTAENDASSNWFTQGADAGRYTEDEIESVRLVSMEGVAYRSYGPYDGQRTFRNHAGREKLRVLGEIPLRKGEGVRDAEGKADTSFLAKIPADVPFTFQTLDRDGLVLNMSQTWHMVRPGEVRTDCGGCHAHSQKPMDFAGTAAARDRSWRRDFSQAKARDVEYFRDIAPIFARSCQTCHSGPQAAARLDLSAGPDRLMNDREARFGIPPVIAAKTWRQQNVSRYVKAFQSRRSLLAWKVFGRRLDGWTNEDHPTERTPGDASTLPAGANPNLADLDYTGTIMPPPGSGAPALSEEEKRLIALWIDLGCPVNEASEAGRKYGWFVDELKPTLTVRWVEDAIQIGMADSGSGLDLESFSVELSWLPKDAAHREAFRQTGDGVWTYEGKPPAAGVLRVEVKDKQGNRSVVTRRKRAAVD
jgi:hypothetical protein